VVRVAWLVRLVAAGNDRLRPGLVHDEPVDSPPLLGFQPAEVREAAFPAVLAGVPLGAYDRRMVGWLIDWDDTTCRTVASIMWRCRLGCLPSAVSAADAMVMAAIAGTGAYRRAANGSVPAARSSTAVRPHALGPEDLAAAGRPGRDRPSHERGHRGARVHGQPLRGRQSVPQQRVRHAGRVSRLLHPWHYPSSAGLPSARSMPASLRPGTYLPPE